VERKRARGGRFSRRLHAREEQNDHASQRVLDAERGESWGHEHGECMTRDKDEASIYDQEREGVESYVRPFRYRRVDFRV